MIEIINFILFPIVWVMEKILFIFSLFIPSTGISILLLSLTFSIFILPIQSRFKKMELRISNKMKLIDIEIKKIDKNLKGEERFLAIDRIYKKNDYHPIHSIGVAASFFVLIPIFISSILLLTQSGVLLNEPFLFVSDLSHPDKLFFKINILPILMFLITLIDSRIRFKNNFNAQLRFLFISLIMFFLVYALPAGLVLYWIGNNIFSLVIAIKNRKQNV